MRLTASEPLQDGSEKEEKHVVAFVISQLCTTYRLGKMKPEVVVLLSMENSLFF